MIREDDKRFMREAIKISVENVKSGGGPFGAVITFKGEIIAKAGNTVTKNNDPTQHAEINAIRKASAYLKTFNLEGCTIYTSCEPCPMCLGAIYWARIDKIYYGNTQLDAKRIHFDDSFIYEELKKPIAERKLPAKQILRSESIKAFQMWDRLDNKNEY